MGAVTWPLSLVSKGESLELCAIQRSFLARGNAGGPLTALPSVGVGGEILKCPPLRPTEGDHTNGGPRLHCAGDLRRGRIASLYGPIEQFSLIILKIQITHF